MHDFDEFERSLGVALRSDADMSVARYEPESVARLAISASHRRTVRIPWRFPRTIALTRVAMAAVISALTIGGALYLIRPGQFGVGPPSPSPSQAIPTAAPSRLGHLTVARGFQTATLLADGRVLIAGGYADGARALTSAELYDPVANAFVSTGSLTVARAEHTATLLADGRVLITGGTNGASSLATAELFDPTIGTFAATGSMANARAFQTATLLADGRVLMTGGEAGGGTVAAAEIYDPARGTFSTTASMAVPGGLQTASLLADGRVLVTGGGDSATDECFASAEIYDPLTGTFSPTASMATPRCGHTATVLPDGRVLIVTGTFNWVGNSWQSSAEIFDPRTRTFASAGSMAFAPAKQTATLLADGSVLIAGGNAVADVSLAAAELYDPATGTFGLTGSMAIARTLHAATLLADGRVLVTGGDAVGWDFNGPFFAAAEIYDPASGTFGPAGSGG